MIIFYTQDNVIVNASNFRDISLLGVRDENDGDNMSVRIMLDDNYVLGEYDTESVQYVMAYILTSLDLSKKKERDENIIIKMPSKESAGGLV